MEGWMLNIYLLSQNTVKDYDTFDSCIVVAPDEDTARGIHPGGFRRWNGRRWVDPRFPHDTERCTNWAPAPKVKVTLVGVAAEGVQGVLCASYNAG